MAVIDASPIPGSILTSAPSLAQVIGRQGSAPLFPQLDAIQAPADDKTPITQEIATIHRNIFIPPTYGMNLRPLDPTLRSRGGGWDYKIYEQAEEDPKAYATLQKRKGALGAYPTQINAASERPIDVAAKEMIERAIKNFNFRQFVEDLMDAVSKGFSVAEMMYALVDGGPSGPEWLPSDAMNRDQRRFRFDDQMRLRLLDWRDMTLGEVLPDRKFLVFTFRAKDGNPYGLGLGSMLWWRAWFKRQNLEHWLKHNEKFASPTPIGKYAPDASPEEKQAVFDAVMSFHDSSAIAAPIGSEFALLESSRAAGQDTFKVFRDAENEDIDLIVLGASALANSGTMQGGTGADVDQDDRLELAQSDANNLAAVLNRTLFTWLCEFNLPGARPPTIQWLMDAEEDLGATADRDTKVQAMGFDPDPAYVKEKYGDHWEPKPEAPPAPDPFVDPTFPQLPPPAPAGAAFAQRIRGAVELGRTLGRADRRDAGARRGLRGLFSFAQKTAAPTDAVADRLAPQLGQHLDPIASEWVEGFRKVIENSASFEEAQDSLIDLYSHMDGEHFAETFIQALAVADLAGRADADHKS